MALDSFKMHALYVLTWMSPYNSKLSKISLNSIRNDFFMHLHSNVKEAFLPNPLIPGALAKSPNCCSEWCRFDPFDCSPLPLTRIHRKSSLRLAVAIYIEATFVVASEWRYIFGGDDLFESVACPSPRAQP